MIKKPFGFDIPIYVYLYISVMSTTYSTLSVCRPKIHIRTTFIESGGDSIFVHFAYAF